MCLYCLRRIHVNGLHEPARLVRADGQQRQIDRTKPLPDLAEKRGVGTVPGEKDARAVDHQHESPPQGAVSIERTARGEVLRRGQRDRQRGRLRVPPPIEFLDPADAR